VSDPASTRILSFVAGGFPLFTPINAVERVAEELHVLLVPFAAPGLVGLLRSGEEMVPLYDLEAFATQHRAALRQQDFALAAVMPTPVGRVAVRLDRLAGLFPAGDPLPGGEGAKAALPERLQPCIGGATHLEGLVAFFFAPDLFAELVSTPA
jgi:hypothetical protein